MGGLLKRGNCKMAVVMLVLGCECGEAGFPPIPLVASSVKWEER